MKNKRVDIALLILRLGVGISMAINHGYGKISGGPEKWADLGDAMKDLGITFLPVFWGFMAAFAEFFGSLFVAIGFLTRGAAFLVAFTMFVAVYGHVIGGDAFKDTSHSLELFCAFACIFLTGAGKFSIDSRVKISKWLQ